MTAGARSRLALPGKYSPISSPNTKAQAQAQAQRQAQTQTRTQLPSVSSGGPASLLVLPQQLPQRSS